MARNRKTKPEEKIGRSLARLRVARAESISGLALASGVAEDRLMSAETGALRLTPEEIIAICKALDVKPSQLMGETD
ncbi:helix-turn-helix domain-containing protein [Acetobacter musti]|uniref:Helix-turn-helix domain-containing protein n=1 Tax=Acetobacter musti TaxID=864732 RepID=A0ABX0JYC7_9PROT|nr:helix-turn-helix domain-containing protein [Acetobacter musti]